jgi:hypothetical protein
VSSETEATMSGAPETMRTNSAADDAVAAFVATGVMPWEALLEVIGAGMSPTIPKGVPAMLVRDYDDILDATSRASL